VGVSFLTPVAALFALLALVPLAIFVGRRRRAERVRRALRLEPSSGRSWVALAVALAAVPVLVGVAAAQPVVTSARTVPQRSDAEVFIVVDTSRSMLASSASGATTRFERARDDALALEEELPGIPVGIASFTDRVLPHLFPTVDQRVFRETMQASVGIERPPPSTSFGTNVTTLDALGVVPTLNFFTPKVKKRALVVFTDGDSQPVSTALASDFAQKPQVHVTFVHMGNVSDRIYASGIAEAGYTQDPTSAATLTAAAHAARGRIVEEGEVASVAADIRQELGTGPTVNRRIEGSRRALMPFIALLAAIPLGFVLLRRNL
jgi:von Willebrand factor type A domain